MHDGSCRFLVEGAEPFVFVQLCEVFERNVVVKLAAQSQLLNYVANLFLFTVGRLNIDELHLLPADNVHVGELLRASHSHS